MSGIFTSAGWQADGKGGSVNVTADSVTVTNYGMVRAGTDGLGDAGAVNITADVLNLTWSGAIRVSTTCFGGLGWSCRPRMYRLVQADHHDDQVFVMLA